MSYLSINDSEREAAQGLADLKNYSKSMSIWSRPPSFHLTDQPNMTTFDYPNYCYRDIFIFPELHTNTPSPLDYYCSPLTSFSHNSPAQIQGETRDQIKEQTSTETDSIWMEDSSDQKEKKNHNKQCKIQKKKSKRKPRWNKDLKNSLSLAVIDQKKLSDVNTFDWQAIGRKTGKSGKACKRQWLTEILPKIQNSFKHH